MILVLQWRMPELVLVTQRRGPDEGLAAQLAVNPSANLPTIIGPPGAMGPAGPAGPQGPETDLSNAVIDGGTFN